MSFTAVASSPTTSPSSSGNRMSTARWSEGRASRSRDSERLSRGAAPLRYNWRFPRTERMLYYLLTGLYVFVCLVLLLVILLQQGKGGDLASAFGGGSSQTAFGARAGATLLTKLTTVFAVLFMVGALLLAVIGQRGPGSVLSGSAPP